jgi:hypothetical protein
MAEIITHAFVTTKPDSPDPSLVSATEWNDGHTFSGGSNGQTLAADNTQPKGIRWIDGTVQFTGSANILGGSPQTVTLATFTANTPAIIILAYATYQVCTPSASAGLNLMLDGSSIANFVVPNGVDATRTLIIQCDAGNHTLTATYTAAGATFNAPSNITLSGMRIGRL